MELITTTHSLTDMEKHDLEIYEITSVSLLHTDFKPAQFYLHEFNSYEFFLIKI